jgi:hypothetical protein
MHDDILVLILQQLDFRTRLIGKRFAEVDRKTKKLIKIF